jgi:hypothetical protein
VPWGARPAKGFAKPATKAQTTNTRMPTFFELFMHKPPVFVHTGIYLATQHINKGFDICEQLYTGIWGWDQSSTAPVHQTNDYMELGCMKGPEKSSEKNQA